MNSSEYNRNYYLEHKEEILKKKKTRKKKHYPRTFESRKNENLKKRYGITLEDYNKMFSKQEGKCRICKTHQSKLKVSLCVDHNHITGAVRGLLCDDCNKGIGCLKDNPEYLKEAIEYLQEIK